MAYSVPVGVTIAAIGVDASVISLGLNPDGTVRVPSLSTPMLTSWFDEGPAPGQDGTAAIYGHVDTAASGPAVFYRLGDLTTCDSVDVTLADNYVAVFRVYQIAMYPKADFPTMTVYGDTPDPELRLITCGGPFDAAAGSYDDNIVVYARLTGTRRLG
jgi:sortase (surface protein transpeptidase)